MPQSSSLSLLEVIFENEELAVINKPAGCVVYAGVSEHQTKALLPLLREAFPTINKIAGERPGIVHRLDRDTSGLLLVAKTLKAQTYLQELFRTRQIEKKYLTLIKGKLVPAQGAIDAPLKKRGGRTSVQVSLSSRNALSYYLVKEYLTDCSYLEVKIATGRTHQIRVHFKTIGYPVVGDQDYGQHKINQLFQNKYGLERQFLHAHQLNLILPGATQKNTFIAPLPADLNQCLEQLRKDSDHEGS